jgi:hypothetical protein
MVERIGRTKPDVYTQAITPAKHVQRKQRSCRWYFLPVRMEDRKLLPRSYAEKGHKKGAQCALFAPSMFFANCT